MQINNKYKEWYYQSDYDLETSEDMLKSGRTVYCVFMCHLSLEKALKGLYIKRTAKFPVKSHSLVFFIEKIGLDISKDYYDFVFMLNKISVITRYPDDLEKLMTSYTRERTESILIKTKEIQSWIKQQ